jgi:hypothetical protein
MIEIKSDSDSLEVAKSGVIWGGVWFELNGEAFPEAHWNDLAAAVMVEVLNAVRELGSTVGRRRIRFFDGPFWIEFERTNSEEISISTSANLSTSGDLDDFSQVVRQVEEAARHLVAACRVMGFSNQDDVRRLEALCEKN